MNFIDKKIVESYTSLLEGLSSDNKIELIENLSRSLKTDKKDKDKSFYKSFGAFGSKKSPALIIKELRASRTFRKKVINF